MIADLETVVDDGTIQQNNTIPQPLAPLINLSIITILVINQLYCCIEYIINLLKLIKICIGFVV